MRIRNPDQEVFDKPVLKKFKMEPKYTHHRSEGLTRRRNKGSALQPSFKEQDHGK